MAASNPMDGARRWGTRLQKWLPAPAYRATASLARRALSLRYSDLSRLAVRYGTDKWGVHWYTNHYHDYFASRRNQRINLLEIGVGGYQDRQQGGQSLRMWKAYFRRANIVGIDIYDKTALREARIDIRQMDQTDAEALTRLSEEYGGFDIVIDDGSHISRHVIRTFEILFPLLRPDGIYAVEDTQTAYWPTWGGGLDSSRTSTGYFQRLTDGLNHAEYPIADYHPTYFDTHITSIAFFHNQIIITKGDNSEPTCSPEERDVQVQTLNAGPESGRG